MKLAMGQGGVQREANEWKQANNLGDEYWLYVVLDDPTPEPRLFRVHDPQPQQKGSE